MSFFERAKAAADDLLAKADVAMSNAGVSVPGIGPDRALRDLGVLAWLEATGRQVDPADRERVMATLRRLEASGRLGPLTVTPPEPYGTPPPPGAAATAAATGAAAGVPAAPPPPPTGSASPDPGGVMPAHDGPAPPPPGSAPDDRPALEEPEGPDTAPERPPPPPPPSWA